MASALGNSLILFLLLSQVPVTTRLLTAPAPHPPMETVQTGLAVLDVNVDPSGKPSQIETIHGMPPFVEPSLGAVRQWTFQSWKDAQAPLPITVVLLFRARTILPDRPYALDLPPGPSAGDSPPRPITIVDPGYPAQSIAEGAVILQLQIDSRGRVRKTDVIADVPSLTWMATHAVSQWRFAPARHDGKEIPGMAVAVISFLRPVLSH